MKFLADSGYDSTDILQRLRRDNVETFYEKAVTPFGNSAKVDSNRKYIGRRAYVVILKG